ncbi:glycosyltransferase [Rufibacter hautae]|uniref:glycosyltransferase n=1 Tax=Rufibacter hautae TaxID=2595005 RepID=UPI00168096E8|nr:glycosyltransferase [Rufibacter hautae]
MKYTKILIITEVYTFGGLETHFYGKILHLTRLGYKVFLVTGSTFLKENLPVDYCEKIYTDFNFSSHNTSQNIVEATQQLVKIIEEENIELVDAHPFFSVIPAFFSAALTQTPFVYTLHGPASLFEGYGQLAEWFVKNLLLPNASLVNNVSEETYSQAKLHVPANQTKVFRNAVDISVFHSTGKIQNDEFRCCLVSRLDYAKVVGIKEFLSLAASSGIPVVDIYGDGPERDNLSLWISENINNSEIAVNLKGISFALQGVYEEYSVVAGMGRVVLEAASMNKPVILVGYDGVKGLLSQELLERASHTNFSGRGLPNIDGLGLKHQLENLSLDIQPYLLSSWIEKNASESQVWRSFSDQIQLLSYQSSELVLDIYSCFVNQKSDIAFTADVELFANIEKVLCSAKYMDTTACKLWGLFEQKAFEGRWLYKLNNAELVITGHFDKVYSHFKEHLAEQYTIVDAEKDRQISEASEEIQRLQLLLLEKEKLLHENAFNFTQLEEKVEQLGKERDEAQSHLLEKERKLSEQFQQLDDLNLQLASASQKVEKVDLKLNHQVEVNKLLEKGLELAKLASISKEERIFELNQKIGVFYAQNSENKHKTKEREQLISDLKNQVSKLKVDNEWYKATFLDRSIWGVIKEKAFGPALKK